MKVTPIIMSAPMVRALIDGRKTQTRRIIKPQPADDIRPHTFPNPNAQGWISGVRHEYGRQTAHFCLFGKNGDILWVRENVWLPCEASFGELRNGADTWKPHYYADGLTDYDIEQYKEWGWKPTPSIHTRRRVSRLTLELSEVRVERLQDISEEDAVAEGIEARDAGSIGMFRDYSGCDPVYGASPVLSYQSLWESLHGPGSWEASPWVWALSFRVHHQNIDAFLKARAA
jgi:hypothetical protein